ncbi:MAG: tetratricopeptide repeat protein [Opitutaceae bacterium]
MRSRLLFAIVALAVAVPINASPLDEAIGLYKEKKYPEARAAFERILAVEPNNAAACFYLGTTLMRRGDKEAVEDALPWLEKATTLEPTNATYLADYGGVAMLVADKRQSPFSSIGLAKKGRDAMEKSLTMDPENMEARVGLWRFYSSAPRSLGLGDDAKAAVQLEEIRKRDPNRASMLLIDAQLRAKHFGQAFKLCEELLAKTPDDFFALFQYARVSIASGQNLERGLSCLKKYVSLETPSSPGSANLGIAWLRIGTIEEKLGHPQEARIAYQKALQIQPNDNAAAAALANLKL